MEWTKEGLRKLYFEKFGLTLTDDELEEQWNAVPDNTLTPRGNQMNIAVSPQWLTSHISRELERTGLPLTDSRFKKVREEIIPAAGYALFLKSRGLGEHVICSSDSPDIVLINIHDNKVPGTAYRRKGVPLEVTFITDQDMAGASGADEAEKLVHILEKNKLGNTYGKEVTLLVVIDAVLQNLETDKVTSLLKNKAKNFHAIDLMITKPNRNFVIANVYPKGESAEISPSNDLHPLMY